MSSIAPLASYLLYLTISGPNSHFCTLEDRAAITSLPNSHIQPVCALYSGNCDNSITGFCHKTLPNAQLACQDINVVAYTTGECQMSQVQICSGSSVSSSNENVCSFSEKRRLGGATQGVVFSTISRSSACQSGNNGFFVAEGCNNLKKAEKKVCTAEKRINSQQCINDNTPSADTKCVYFTGEGCKEGKICRRSEKVKCSLCFDKNVLFYIDRSCESSLIKTSKKSTNSRDPNAILNLSNDVREVKSETLADGTVRMTPVSSKVSPPEGGVVQPLTNPNDEVLDLGNDVPEVEAETLEDGSVVFTPVENKSLAPEESQAYDPNAVLDLSNDVPEVESETLADGTVVMTPVSSEILPPEGGVVQPVTSPNDEVLDLGNDVPEVEAETLEDGSVALTPVENKSLAPEDKALPGSPNKADEVIYMNDAPLTEVIGEDENGLVMGLVGGEGEQSHAYDPNAVLDLSNDVPEVESETLPDGTVVMTPVSSEILPPEGGVVQPVTSPNDEVLDLGNDVPEVEAETLEDGSIVFTLVGNQESQPNAVGEGENSSTSTSNDSNAGKPTSLVINNGGTPMVASSAQKITKVDSRV